MTAARQWTGPTKLKVRLEPRSNYAHRPGSQPATRARQLALAGIEVRATQSQNTGNTGGQTAHEPAGSPKGGQFTSRPSGAGGGYQSILPPASAYKTGGGKKKLASVPAGTPQAPTEPRTMKVGDSGEDVRYAQYAMSLLGFKVTQDGQYGPETEAAVKQIQERLGVKKPNGHLSAAQLHKLQDAVRLSPCIGGGQRDLGLEAQWEARDVEDVDDELDEDTEALIAALGEFIGSDERSFNEALHPRNPKGSVGGGRFRSITDRIVAALSDWKHGDGPNDPLQDFNRDQLLKAAKAHGHTFRRGASIEEIKAQILDDVRNGTRAEKAAAPKLPGAPADHRRFTIQLGGKVDPAAAREVEVENKIRQAWNDAQKAPGGWVGFARLRDSEALRDVPREDVDAALKRLAREPGVRVAPNENTKSLRREDINAAVHIGDSPRHMIAFERGHSPSASGKTPMRPLPSTGGTATDVGIFAAPSTGKLSLYRESDTGKKQGRAIKSFDDMGGLEAWARDNGHTELADYAKAEQARAGGAAKVAKVAPAKRARSKAATPVGPHIEVVPAVRGHLTDVQIGRGEHLTPAGRKALDALGPAGHPRIAAIPDTEGKIREAYRMLAIPGGGFDHFVSLEDLRKLIGDQASRGDVDATLKRMVLAEGKDARLVPQSYYRENAATRIPAAVMIGGQEHNQLQINDPSLVRPSQFGAVVMAEELDARRTGGERDPMMANLSDAELEAAIKDRAARDPVVARDLANRTPADPLAGLEGLTTVQKRAALRKRGLSKAEIDSLAPLEKKPRKAARALEALGVTRALGHDVTPGHDELHHYWTRGPGLAKWAESPKPWTTLVAHLTKYVGPEKAKIYASRWFIEVFHFAAGSDLNRVTHGKPPRGHRVGPG